MITEDTIITYISPFQREGSDHFKIVEVKYMDYIQNFTDHWERYGHRTVMVFQQVIDHRFKTEHLAFVHFQNSTWSNTIEDINFVLYNSEH